MAVWKNSETIWIDPLRVMTVCVSVAVAVAVAVDMICFVLYCVRVDGGQERKVW